MCVVFGSTVLVAEAGGPVFRLREGYELLPGDVTFSVVPCPGLSFSPTVRSVLIVTIACSIHVQSNVNFYA